MKIFKYPLEITGHQRVPMPEGAEILALGNQNETLVVWALVDETASPVDREFVIVGTGDIIPVDQLEILTYLETVTFRAGFFVAHVYEMLTS